MEDFLTLYYDLQYVQNESTETDSGTSRTVTYSQLDHSPIIEGTLTGTVYRLGAAIQTFVATSSNKCVFTDIGRPKVKAVRGDLNLQTSELTLEWNEAPGPNQLTVNYEYKMRSTPEASFDPLPAPGGRPDGRKLFEKFFNHNQIETLLCRAGTIATWDFNSCDGDTIKEKYELLFVKVAELTGVLMQKGASGFFWVVCPPAIGNVLETVSYDFRPAHRYGHDEVPGMGPDGQVPMSLHSVMYLGLVKSRWRVYVDPLLNEQRMLIGVNDGREDDSHYARCNIYNCII